MRGRERTDKENREGVTKNREILMERRGKTDKEKEEVVAFIYHTLLGVAVKRPAMRHSIRHLLCNNALMYQNDSIEFAPNEGFVYSGEQLRLFR